MSAEDRLDELLLTWRELTERGERPDLEAICRDCPELIDELRQSIAALERMAWLDDNDDATIDVPLSPRGSSSSAVGQPGGGPTPDAPTEPRGDPTRRERRPLPQVVGDYNVLQVIGIGGMGTVYKAIHRHMQRVVALKIVRFDVVASTEAIARFHREMKAAARLDHPNIVTAHDAGEDRGIFYLAMEFVDGCDLARQVQEHGTLPVAQAVDYVIQAARGLAYAHDQGITHRDIKPANLLVSRCGTVKILDLGLARFREGSVPDVTDILATGGQPLTIEDAELTQAGTIHGTLAYMAPEQREDSKDADHRADIYSLGCTLYFLLTGERRPPVGMDAGQQATANAAAAVSLRSRPDVPSELVDVLQKMTAPHREDRPHSMNEVIESLLGVIESGRVAAHRQRRMRAVKHSLIGAAVIMLIALGWGAVETTRERRAESLVKRLLEAPTEQVPEVVARLGPYRHRAERRLRSAYDLARSQRDAGRQLRASLGLLPLDPRQVDHLVPCLLVANDLEFLVLRDALREHGDDLTGRLWSVWEDSAQPSSRRFRAASALANFAPRDTRWSLTTSGAVALMLVAEPADSLDHWAECLRPVRDHLQIHLQEIYRQPEKGRADNQIAAARILSRWFAGEPDRLVNLLVDADPAQCAVLLPILRAHPHELFARLEAELDRPVPPETNARLVWAKRQANLYAALVAFGESERPWASLQHSLDPTVRSYLIQRLGPSGVSPEVLIRRLESEPDVSVRRALILALGGFDLSPLAGPRRDSLVRHLGALYREDADPGIHGAAEWLLRVWDQQEELATLDWEQHPPGQRGWYLTRQGQTMVVVPGPVTFSMGAPMSEAGAHPDEALHPVCIARTFSIGANEVSVEEYERFLEDHPDLRRPGTDHPQAGPNYPQSHVTWQSAIAFCRWLGQKEGLREEDQCYPPVPANAEHINLPADFLDRPGYRLATECEWEYACQAGARTSRFFGDPDDLLDEYGWNSRGKKPAGTHPVGRSKPNDFGMFDQYGNVLEWCHHAGDDDWPEVAEVGSGAAISYPAERFRLRGGSHRNRREDTRSASRFQYQPGRMMTYVGFRLARTLPTRSLKVMSRSQPVWGQAGFLVQGPNVPFAVTQVRGGVNVSPLGGTTPARLVVTSPDQRTRRFSLVIQQTDTPETVTVHGLTFSADWTMNFHASDRSDRDALDRPEDWEQLVAGQPIATRKSPHMNFEWGPRAPANNVPRDNFAFVATATAELPTGRYELWATADNGVRVFVDGSKKIDFSLWLPDTSTPHLLELPLESGAHCFRVEYYESRDQAHVQVGLRPLD